MFNLSLFTSLPILAATLVEYSQALYQHPFIPGVSNDKRVLTSEIDQFIEGILSSWNSPGGVSVAIVHFDEGDGLWTIETKGYGIANLAESKPVTEDSLFCIASNSKLFTALATGLLVSNKSLITPVTWDTKVKSILPDLWELQDDIATSESTITDVMSHRTGVPRHDLMYTRDDTTLGILERLRHLKTSSGFRETWQYSNNMYTLLSYLPTALIPSRPSFGRYVRDHVLNPLGLHSTTYSPRVARGSGNLADPLAREGVNKTENIFGKGKPRVMRFPGWFLDEGEDGSYKSGAGGIIMNAKDAATWLQVLLLDGKNPHTGEQVIPSDVIHKVASGIMVQTGEP
ncbi:beta-lactamase/transpeptidase-like protein [Marasmius fiardii PR-910]|nr:beta-lactamase/transpeptidase-like protein [Marasmius fiardii PR-910]